MELAGENGIKTVYDLQSYWTSMAAILDSLGFTFLIDRMTEVLTPDIYIELTGQKWLFLPRVIQIYTKFANFTGLYFLHFTTFSNQINFAALLTLRCSF